MSRASCSGTSTGRAGRSPASCRSIPTASFRTRRRSGAPSPTRASSTSRTGALHARGLRYKLHDSTLLGRPDLVFPRYRAVCFVHGCFWHRHDGCPRATKPASNRTYWERKFEANVRRDRNHQAALREAGWRVGIVWECALQQKGTSEQTAAMVEDWLKGKNPEFTASRQ